VEFGDGAGFQAGVVYCGEEGGEGHVFLGFGGREMMVRRGGAQRRGGEEESDQRDVRNHRGSESETNYRSKRDLQILEISRKSKVEFCV